MMATFRFRHFILVMLWTGLSAGLAAQDYTIRQSVVIPAVCHVGDEVELRLSIRSDFAAKMLVPETLPQPNWGSIHGMQLIPKDGELELRVQFTSYAVGTISLPPINLGPVGLEGINVFISSLADGAGTTQAGLREPLLSPGLWWRVILQALVIILIPVVVTILILWGGPQARQLIRLRREAMPYRRFLRAVRFGNAEHAVSSASGYYTWLLGEVRLYLNERCGFAALSATSSEIEVFLSSRVRHGETVQALLSVFRHADRVKFAMEPSSSQSLHSDFQLVERAISHIEHEEKLLARTVLGDAPETIKLASRELGKQLRGRLRGQPGGAHDSL